MQPNVGGYDRLARAALGPVAIVVGVALLIGAVSLDAGGLGAIVGVLALVVGVVFVATAALRWCPLNAVTAIDTTAGGTVILRPPEEPEGDPRRE
ncbi:YgaP family membrane protein [Haloarcula litorea]|uniref:YgaP family membrane protein n=1 Tax=Haloarcula litorea TaxID=3032579 RepID=UPI0023E8EFA2|nr:DUF2892 domain-containing protein [Halomicroarcula sp. GDY20]